MDFGSLRWKSEGSKGSMTKGSLQAPPDITQGEVFLEPPGRLGPSRGFGLRPNTGPKWII